MASMNIERNRSTTWIEDYLQLAVLWIAILAVLAVCGGCDSNGGNAGGQLPDVAGRWEVTDDMNKNAFALVQVDSIVFFTRSRQLGEFQGNVTATGVEAPANNLTATISEDQQILTWSNGMVWQRLDTQEMGGRPWQR
jgi:hypothetical protein